jgi:molybdopterin/thiamine biosynthesis adenylyltransferase
VVVSLWHPRIKPEHGLRRIRGNKIRIGGSVYGIAAEVVDDTGAIWTMLSAADGTRTAEAIVDHVLDVHPGERASDVRTALETFAEAGYLEDAAAPDPQELSGREKERYGRSRLFYRWIDLTPRTTSWEPQLRLRTARAVLVGVGGTGGAAGLALAASGVGRLHCVDSDAVELSNLNRQTLFAEADIGQSKVDVAVRRLREVNSDIEITGEQRQVLRVEDFADLVAGTDVLVLCADRPGAIRGWANAACLRSGTPWVDAGYHGPVAQASAFTPGNGPCYECFWLGEHDRWKGDQPDRGYSIERGGSNAVMAPAAGLSGNLAAHLALALLTGVPAIEPGQLQGVNLMAADHQVVIKHPRRTDCPACGAGDAGC